MFVFPFGPSLQKILLMVEALFGEILKEMRKRQGISQSELAEKCALDRTFISMLERGVRQPTISTLFKLAKALNTTPSEILLKMEEANEDKK